MEGLDPDGIFIELRDEIPISSAILSIDEMNQIDRNIKDNTDFGVMLYYGGFKIHSETLLNERQYTV